MGVVLIRMPTAGSEEKARTVEKVFSAFGERLFGSLTVVHSDVIRKRLLPDRSSENPE